MEKKFSGGPRRDSNFLKIDWVEADHLERS